ncbi:CHASE2 domain-containing protein [Pseudocolwellia sp. AS88]|nr:CHASE2 domain-containing protein [Pseudocolwellia sp. AS88]MDO7084507.1 CHASE2 domain-containing protein [Pseudocolwellia sp. AS88]
MGMCITCLVIGLQFINLSQVQGFLERIEGMLYDLRLNTTLSTDERQFDEQIVIIDIDEKSMQEQGRYPWSRSKVAQLVEKLHEAGVLVIAFDIFFAEPERNPVDEILNNNKKLDNKLIDQITALSSSVDADTIFSNTLSDSEVILGFLFDNEAKTIGYLPDTSIVWQKNQYDTSQVESFDKVLGNIEQLQTSAIGAGFINSLPESDGFIRKASLVLNYNNTLYPSLALEAARVYTLNDSINAITESSQNISWLQGLSFGKHIIPTNEKGQVIIPFRGEARSFEYISATDVLNERLAEGYLEGAIAFVGTSAVGLADLRTTSVGVQYPGVEVHANVFESLIHPEIIPVEPDIGLALSLLMLAFTGIILSFSMTKQTPGNIVLICLVFIIIHISINWYLWSALKVSLPLFQNLLLITLLTLYYAAIGFMIESYKRKNIKGMFNQYVPPAYIDKLIKQGKNLELKSEKRNMSVLFADIRSFTDLSENFTPEELTEFMQIYLTDVTSIIFENQGTIDKYVGDMVMAFWNAPLDDEDHATHAVITALKMIQATKKLSVIFNKRDWPSVNIGVGISSGDMNVGDMGSTYRKAYTVLGDEVNLGSRIESLTKFYGVDILFTEKTFNQLVPNKIVCRQIDKIKVKGKNQAVTVYQPLAFVEETNQETEQNLRLHQEGINAYNQGQWDLAVQLFTQLKQNEFYTTTIYDIYLNRLASLKDNPPKEWDGTYTHQSK